MFGASADLLKSSVWHDHSAAHSSPFKRLNMGFGCRNILILQNHADTLFEVKLRLNQLNVDRNINGNDKINLYISHRNSKRHVHNIGKSGLRRP